MTNSRNLAIRAGSSAPMKLRGLPLAEIDFRSIAIVGRRG